jgi:hypothetical protein
VDGTLEFPIDSQVAALTTDPGSQEPMVVLATVRGFRANKYELRDEDDGGTYNLGRQSIVALGAASKGGVELKKNTIVLAM